MNSFRALVNKINDGLHWSYKESEPYFVTFGVAVLVGVIGFYFLNQGFNNDLYEDFPLRCISAALVVPLIFNKYWPHSWGRFLIWYWYLVLLFTLPFFFSFMILMNPSSTVWQINGMVCLIVLVLFVDLWSFLLLLTLGVSSGVFYYQLKKVGVENSLPTAFRQALYSYLGPIIYIILFSRKKEKIQQHKIHSMKMIAEFIAHELRTPLSAMTVASQNLTKLMPAYCDAYKKAKEAKIPVTTLSLFQEKNLAELPLVMENVSRNANTMISMLLINLKENAESRKLDSVSMAACVRDALDAYPFAPGERALVNWQDPELTHGKDALDFIFNGHIELTKHVLFNLLKNALHEIASAGRGEIFITIEPGQKAGNDMHKRKFNRLLFKDTASGIAQDKVRDVFNRFYTNKAHGTGIGLAFCKSTINEFGGDITCTSKLGEHATFIISFPIPLAEDRVYELPFRVQTPSLGS